jgi:hypothetical protein
MACFTRNIAKPSAGSPSSDLESWNPLWARSRLELTAAGTLHTATARSESFVLRCKVTWRRVRRHLDLVSILLGAEDGMDDRTRSEPLGGHDTRRMMHIHVRSHVLRKTAYKRRQERVVRKRRRARDHLPILACGTASSDPRPHSNTVT